MKRSALGLAAIGALGALAAAAVPQPIAVAAKPPRKRKKGRMIITDYKTEFSRSKYIPAGVHRNCGDAGISPKKVKS